MSQQAPLVHTMRVPYPAVAAGSDDSFPIGEAPLKGTITRAYVISDGAITGANTNTRRHEIQNGGQAGAGALVAASKQYDSGVNAAANDNTELTVSGTPANVAVAQGDVLRVHSIHVGTGLADPGGVAFVEITRAD
jgi:hypothetical protein